MLLGVDLMTPPAPWDRDDGNASVRVELAGTITGTPQVFRT
jgi:hypothetical protein